MNNQFIKKLFSNRFWMKNRNKTIVVAVVVWVALMVILLVCGQRDIGAHEAGDEISQLAQNIRNHYRTRPDFWGLSTREVIAQKIYPLSMSVKGEELYGYFNTPVQIGADAAGTSVMPTVRSFVIAYTRLSKAQCIALASNKFDQNFLLGISSMNIVNSSGTYSFDWNSKATALPAKKSIVKEYCSPKNNDIIFNFE